MKIDFEDFGKLSGDIDSGDKEVNRILEDLSKNIGAVKNGSPSLRDIGREVIDIMKNEIKNANSQKQLVKIIMAYYLFLNWSGLENEVNIYISFKAFQISYQEVYGEIPFKLPYELDLKKIMVQLKGDF